jgi:hypothetical protein
MLYDEEIKGGSYREPGQHQGGKATGNRGSVIDAIAVFLVGLSPITLAPQPEREKDAGRKRRQALAMRVRLLGYVPVTNQSMPTARPQDGKRYIHGVHIWLSIRFQSTIYSCIKKYTDSTSVYLFVFTK